MWDANKTKQELMALIIGAAIAGVVVTITVVCLFKGCA